MEIQWESLPPTKGRVYPLPDGGTVEFTDDEYVSMGDGFTFRLLTYRRGPVEIVFEVRDGIPGCTGISLATDGGFIRQKDLAAIRLDDIRDSVYTVAGIGLFDADGEDYAAGDAEARKALARAASRRKITPEFLRRVAEIYQTAPVGERTAAIRAAFSVDERQAFRYIARARKAGFIK